MSFKFIEMFEFQKQDTIIHRLNPLSKGFLVLTYFILVFLFETIALMILLLLSTIPLILIAHLTKNIIKGLNGLGALITFILIFTTFVESFNFALYVIFRILVIMIIFSVFFQTTTPEELSMALLKIHVPYHIAFALSLTFRFVPTMATETQKIIDAQISRGHKIKEGGSFQQMRNLIPILTPLLISSIRRAYHVASALETRGFGYSKKPTQYHTLKIKGFDIIIILMYTFILIIGIFIKINVSEIPLWLLFDLTI